MLWMSGPDARCTFFNKAWLDFTGLSYPEQNAHDWGSGVHPEDRKRCVDKYLSAFKSQEAFRLEYRLRRHDGIYRWMLHDGVPRYDDDGTFLVYVGSCYDMTVRRDVEEHLQNVTGQFLNAQEIERCRIGRELGEEDRKSTRLNSSHGY